MQQEAVRMVVQLVVGAALMPFFQWLKARTGWKGLGFQWIVWLIVLAVSLVVALLFSLFKVGDLTVANFFLKDGAVAIFINQTVYMVYKSVLKSLGEE